MIVSTAYRFVVWRWRPNSTSILRQRKRIRLVQQAYWKSKEAARSLHPHSTRPRPSSLSETVLLLSSTASWRRWSAGRSTSSPLNITTCSTNWQVYMFRVPRPFLCLSPSAQILPRLNQYQRSQGCCPHRRLSPSHPTMYVAYRA